MTGAIAQVGAVWRDAKPLLQRHPPPEGYCASGRNGDRGCEGTQSGLVRFHHSCQEIARLPLGQIRVTGLCAADLPAWVPVFAASGNRLLNRRLLDRHRRFGLQIE